MDGLTVLDASVLIAYFGPGDAHTEKSATLLAQAESLAASTITLAEVLVGAARTGRAGEMLDALADLSVEEVPLGKGSAEGLALLRAETGLRIPDCCVLLAADAASAEAVATFDERLAKAATQRGYRPTDS
ncbi:MAG TPA: PIN domain-containing protein [Solirubrobacteraceae bacterium]|nr:PIN domain-containing protein [Solirubrobacteraceae bacterium]